MKANFYVRMTDSFMSGWGLAENKTNVLVIACDTAAQAFQIFYAAKDRPEMKRVAILQNKPKNRSGVLYSWRTFYDMGGPWLDGWATER